VDNVSNECGGGHSANRQKNFRYQLLTTVSAVALMASVGSALADDGGMSSIGHFTLQVSGGPDWYGGQGTEWFNSGSGDRVGPRQGWDFAGKATFQPTGSDWIISAGVQYGRANSSSANIAGFYETEFGTGTYTDHASHKENHFIADFEVGQDVGLGMFNGGSSVISGGLRYAHFDAKTSLSFSSSSKYNTFKGSADISRTFSGGGPVVSWDASTPIFHSSPFSLDWGADFAYLFGTQKVTFTEGGYEQSRHQGASIPSLGGYLAVSYHFCGCDDKVSLGYMAQSYFGVLDGGSENREQVDRSFSGPYLSVSVGTN
jgi:hypothetical protein